VDTTDPPNPYEAPKAVPDQRDSPACNFCGESPERGSLVQAPEQDVFICASCARIASPTIESHETLKSLPLAVFSLALGVALMVIVPVNWLLWDDEAGVGALFSIVGCIIGLICLSHFAATVRYRWKRRRSIAR
jgi:hypothetical protein